MKPSVVCYRHADSRDIAGRIYDHVLAKLGVGRIIMDVYSIPAGQDHERYLDTIIPRSRVVIAVIGPRWAHGDALENRLRNDPRDRVRHELKLAFRRRIRVIPVLVGDASLPNADDLPEDLRELRARQSITIRSDGNFHQDVDRLIGEI